MKLRDKVTANLNSLEYFLSKQKEYRNLNLKGIHLELTDFAKEFRSTLPLPLILNDRPPCITKDDREELNKLLRTDIEGDMLNIVPTCSCGAVHGADKKNQVCPECHTFVLPITERPIASNVWIRPPVGVADYMNPTVWGILRNTFTISKFSIIEYLCDASYRPRSGTIKKQNEIIEKLHQIFPGLGTGSFKRSYNFFVKRFDFIIESLCGAKNLIKRSISAEVLDFVQTHRKRIFTRVLPIPNKLVFITEKTSVNIYADSDTRHALEAAQMIASLDETSEPERKLVQWQSRVVKINNCMADYAKLQTGATLGTKEGLNRKEIYGTRMTYSGRAVIGSLSTEHRYDEIHLPWSYSVGLLKDHLINKLLKRGLSIPEINGFLIEHVSKYHPLIDELFKEIIEETGLDGIPCILQRNPTLARGSLQCFFITKVKTDVEDVTIAMSTLAIAVANADYDGDALNNWLVLDRTMYKYLSRLAPHNTVFDINSPRQISGATKIHAPVTETVYNYIDSAYPNVLSEEHLRGIV